MLGILIVLAGITVGVIGLLGAGVIHSPSQAAVLLLALVALHTIGGRQLLKGLLVGAGILMFVVAAGILTYDFYLLLAYRRARLGPLSDAASAPPLPLPSPNPAPTW